jgi:hypothetical protein
MPVTKEDRGFVFALGNLWELYEAMGRHSEPNIISMRDGLLAPSIREFERYARRHGIDHHANSPDNPEE